MCSVSKQIHPAATPAVEALLASDCTALTALFLLSRPGQDANGARMPKPAQVHEKAPSTPLSGQTPEEGPAEGEICHE